jgi:hypothetical protein
LEAAAQTQHHPVLSTPTSRPPFGAEPVEPNLVPAHNRTVMPVAVVDSGRRHSTNRH